MPTLILMVGLPRSGKTTQARLLGYPIVSPDAIRLAVSGQRFSGVDEPRVWATARTMVQALFRAGQQTVILDATNGTRSRRESWRSGEWIRKFHLIDTDVATCRQRAADAGDQSLLPVIDRMHAQWESPEANELGPDEGWFEAR